MGLLNHFSIIVIFYGLRPMTLVTLNLVMPLPSITIIYSQCSCNIITNQGSSILCVSVCENARESSDAGKFYRNKFDYSSRSAQR